MDVLVPLSTLSSDRLRTGLLGHRVLTKIMCFDQHWVPKKAGGLLRKNVLLFGGRL